MTKTAQLQAAFAMVESGHVKAASPWATVAKPLLKGFGKAFQAGGMGLKSKALGAWAGSLRQGGRMLGKADPAASRMMRDRYVDVLTRKRNLGVARDSLAKGLAGRELQGFNAARTAGKVGVQGLSAAYFLDYLRQISKNNRLQNQVGQYENDYSKLFDAPVSSRLSYLFNSDPNKLVR
jgi:hypothetical protein